MARKWLLGLALAAAVGASACTAGPGGANGCGGSVDGAVPACSHIPSSTPAGSPGVAPPEVVLSDYLAALQAGDCRTAHQFATSTFIVGNGELCGVLHVSAFTPLTGPATPRDGEVVFSSELTTSGGDVSMPDGQHTWFYTLDRQSNGAWRITGGGSGP
jgi:hypothetical protein